MLVYEKYTLKYKLVFGSFLSQNYYACNCGKMENNF